MPRKAKVNPAPKKPSTNIPPIKARAKKAADAKPQMEVNMTLQFKGFDWSLKDLQEKIILAYVAEGHRRGRIKTLSLYVKPEEHKVYYVINEKNTGYISI